VEERDYWVADWSQQVLTLPGMTQAVAVRRRFTPVTDGVEPKKVEWRYYGTSAPPELAGPDVLAAAVRSHWQIENCLHYPKDYTMGEDRHVLRTGRTPTNLSHMRSIVVGLLSCLDIDDLPAQTLPQKMAYLSGDLDLVMGMLKGQWQIK
jgi:hypothetical protein